MEIALQCFLILISVNGILQRKNSVVFIIITFFSDRSFLKILLANLFYSEILNVLLCSCCSEKAWNIDNNINGVWFQLIYIVKLILWLNIQMGYKAHFFYYLSAKLRIIVQHRYYKITFSYTIFFSISTNGSYLI